MTTTTTTRNADGTCTCGNQCRACGDCAYVNGKVVGVYCGPDQCLVEKAADEAAACDGPVFTELADAEAHATAATVPDGYWQHPDGLVAFRLA